LSNIQSHRHKPCFFQNALDCSRPARSRRLQNICDIIVQTGAETVVNCSADGVEILASIKERVVLKPEDEVFQEFDSAQLHIFCAKTGLVQ